MKTVFLGLLISILAVGCSSGSNPDRAETGTNTLGSESVTVVSGASTLSFSSSGTTGTGSVRSVTPLSEIDGEANFSTTMSLSAGGRVTLVAFSDISMVNGVEVEFYRPSSATALEVRLKYGTTTYDATSSFAGVDASTALTFAVDIHNVEKPAHILIWNDSAGVANADDFLFNTGVVSGSSPGDGKGIYWGIRLESASVSTISKAAIRHEDEE